MEVAEEGGSGDDEALSASADEAAGEKGPTLAKAAAAPGLCRSVKQQQCTTPGRA